MTPKRGGRRSMVEIMAGAGPTYHSSMPRARQGPPPHEAKTAQETQRPTFRSDNLNYLSISKELERVTTAGKLVAFVYLCDKRRDAYGYPWEESPEALAEAIDRFDKDPSLHTLLRIPPEARLRYQAAHIKDMVQRVPYWMLFSGEDDTGSPSGGRTGTHREGSSARGENPPQL